VFGGRRTDNGKQGGAGGGRRLPTRAQLQKGWWFPRSGNHTGRGKSNGKGTNRAATPRQRGRTQEVSPHSLVGEGPGGTHNRLGPHERSHRARREGSTTQSLKPCQRITRLFRPRPRQPEGTTAGPLYYAMGVPIAQAYGIQDRALLGGGVRGGEATGGLVGGPAALDLIYIALLTSPSASPDTPLAGRAAGASPVLFGRCGFHDGSR